MTLLEACALYVGEQADRFTSIATNGDSILRIIHYPPVAGDRHPKSIRAGAHEDINLITLLCEATDGGLELLQRDGTWRPIHALKGQIVVDTGDMIQNMTNGLLKSTTHRVVNPDNSRARRFSMPFFVHPRAEASLRPLDSCLAKTEPSDAYRNITAGEYLHERLVEIGLYKK
jgi:isopenicillin N synthase-like dioxygenase